MLAVERRKLFLDTINEKGIVTVTALAQLGQVTEETVRRDLQTMEQEGLVLKTHGGAMPNDSSFNEVNSEIRQNVNLALKNKIALAAADLVKPGDTLFLDASTTALTLARALKRMKNIRVITNSLHILDELSYCQEITLIGVGGQLSHRNQSLVGSAAERFLEQHYFASIFFFSCRGISPAGELFESSEQEAAVKQAMRRNAERTVMLCDTTKFGRTGPVRLGTVDGVSAMITDKMPENNWGKMLGEKKVQVISCRQ